MKLSCWVGAALFATASAIPNAALAQATAAKGQTQGSVIQLDNPAELDQAALEQLVARIALYPDELVALISASSLFPLQIVEAERYLKAYEQDKSLKPKEDWDGSVVSLLNYPEIVKMMSEDLEWTQDLADALATQQKDLLIAIQQLREEALAKDIIKSDDKITVVEEKDNIVIQSSSTEVIYVPQYNPEMLYVEGATYAPISYYDDPYPYYWYPTATFFAGATVGAIWGAAIDWDDWGIWGGEWDGDIDVDIDCDRCFNDRDFSGKIDFKDVDWANVDRSKLKFDRNQFAKADRAAIAEKVKADGSNALRDKAKTIQRDAASNLPSRANKAKDVRKSTVDGLRDGPGGSALNGRAGATLPDIPRPTPRSDSRPDVAQSVGTKPSTKAKAAGKKKMAGKTNKSGKQSSGLGKVERGKTAKVQSNRGKKSVGYTPPRSVSPQRGPSRSYSSGPRYSGGGRSAGPRYTGGGSRGGGGRGGGRR